MSNYVLKSDSILLTKLHFHFFFCPTQTAPCDLPDEVLAPVLDFKSRHFNAALCQNTNILSPVYIDYLAQMCNFLSHQHSFTKQAIGLYPNDHPITIFHNYLEFAVIPSIRHSPDNLSPTINHLLVFAFSFGSTSCKDDILRVLLPSSFISYLLEHDPHILHKICDYLSQRKSPPVDYYDFLTELNQQILNAPKTKHLTLLHNIIPILERDPSQQMVASFSATLLLVTLYTHSNLDTNTLNYFAKKISPPTLFSQSIGQILYLLAISSPSNISASSSHLFASFVGFIDQHCTTEYFPASYYTNLTTQFAISNGRLDILQFLHSNKMAFPTKSDIQLIMRNNKSYSYSVNFFNQMGVSPEELAINILQSSNSNHLSVFSYLDHLLQTLHLLPHAFNSPYMDATFSRLILKLGPTFSEYDRLDPQCDYSDSFLKVIDTLASKGARCEKLPAFFPKVASLYLSKNKNQVPPNTTQRLHDLLRASLTKLLTKSSAWLVFSPFSSGKIYRTTIFSNVSLLHKLDPVLLKKHAFAIRHMLLWKNLSWFSYLYCCVSSRYASEKLTSVSQQYRLPASCLQHLVSSSQAYYLPAIDSLRKSKSPPRPVSTLPKLPAHPDSLKKAASATAGSGARSPSILTPH